MDIVSLCPLPALGFVWQPRAGAFAQAVIVKATFVLQPSVCALAPEQDGLNEEDNHWNDDPTRSVYAPSDRAPFKPKVDVMLVGYAFAPGGLPVRSLVARLVVGKLEKAIEVWCDRKFRLQDGQPLDGPRFAKMPLRWERASGGAETDNPVGMRFDGPADVYGTVDIPNLQPPGSATRRSGAFAPVCFAPVGERWPRRVRKLGGFAGALLSGGWEGKPLPEGLDYAYFQAAPGDQRVSELREDERIVLENLRPDHARLETRLPGVRPRAVVERATGEREEVALVADTLWFDTDRGVCSVVWRGRVGLRHGGEAGRVVVSLAGESEEVVRAAPGAEEYAGEDWGVAVSTAIGVPASMSAGPILPFSGGSGSSEAAASSAPRVGPKDAALPFGRGPGWMGATRAPELPSVLGAEQPTITLPSDKLEEGRATPVASRPTPPPLRSVPTPPAQISPPPLLTQIPRVDAISQPGSGSAWGTEPREGGQGLTVGQMMLQAPVQTPKPTPMPMALLPSRVEPEAAPVVDEAAAKRGWKPAGPRSRDGAMGPPLSPNPVVAGASAASDAAAAVLRQGEGGERGAGKRVAVASASPPKAVIDLLWYDPAAMARIRRQAGWKEILGQIKGKAFEDELSGDSPPEKRQEVKDRREVAGLLARGEAVDMAGLEAALGGAVTEDGTFVPPLVLLAGELEFPFDELETLKATMAAMAPLASGDKRLKETLETTEELLKTAWIKGASGIAEGLTGKLKEVFAQGNRMLPPRYLEGHTERMLLEQRAYQKRTLLGKVCLRTLLSVPGAGGGVPVYLPEALGLELPSFQRFGVRMVGEVRGKVDQYEGQEVAVRGVAVGRVSRVGRRLE